MEELRLIKKHGRYEFGQRDFSWSSFLRAVNSCQYVTSELFKMFSFIAPWRWYIDSPFY